MNEKIIHTKITAQQIGMLVEIRRCGYADLTPFEKDLMKDRMAAVKKFGSKAIMTKRQGEILNEIWIKTMEFSE